MSTPFKMKGFSGFGNSPMKQNEESMRTVSAVDKAKDIWEKIKEYANKPSEYLEKRRQYVKDRKNTPEWIQRKKDSDTILRERGKIL